MNQDLEKHKAAIAKLGEKLHKTTEALSKARQSAGPAGAAGTAAVSSAEMLKLQEKLDQLNEELAEEKKQGRNTEDLFDKYKLKVAGREQEYNDATLQLAKNEIENDELKNEVRSLSYMVEDLE